MVTACRSLICSGCPYRLLIYLGFAFFQCHLREKTVGILFDYIVFYFLIGIEVCILLLSKTAYHALKF